MENSFEDYLEDNKGAFEQGGPRPAVWRGLEGKLEQHYAKKARAVRIAVVKWVAAASILAVVLISALFVLRKRDTKETIVRVDVHKQDTAKKMEGAYKRDSENVRTTIAATELDAKKQLDAVQGKQTVLKPLMYYVAIVKAKQLQLEPLRQTSPALYASFKAATEDLSTLYAQLEASLPGSIDREKILRNMVQNLQMQAAVLDDQLQLLNNNTKQNNGADDKADDKI